MPIIDTPAGTLEVTNAVLRASEFRATQKIGVANNAPTKNFSVGTKFHVDAASIDPVNITGNVVAKRRNHHSIRVLRLLSIICTKSLMIKIQFW